MEGPKIMDPMGNFFRTAVCVSMNYQQRYDVDREGYEPSFATSQWYHLL